MGMGEYPNGFWDWFFLVGGAVYITALAVWVWRHGRVASGPQPFWAPLGWCALLLGMSCGAQLAARGVDYIPLSHVLLVWLALLLPCALILGVRHLLSRRQRGKVAS
jgi:hypothetical protein